MRLSILETNGQSFSMAESDSPGIGGSDDHAAKAVRRIRRWPVDVKRRIVEETFAPGSSVDRGPPSRSSADTIHNSEKLRMVSPELVSKAEGAGRICQLPRGFRERDRDLAWPGARNFSPGRGLPRGRLAVRRVAAALRAIAGSSPRLARMGTSGACRSDLVHDATPEARSFTPRRFLPMFVPFRRYFSERKTQDVAARAAGSVARRLNRRRPTLESLETRNLLSFIGSEHQVSLDPHTNFASDNASSSNGTSVAVWDAFSSTTTDIWAQRFDRFGNPTGAPIQVDTLASDASVDPHVSMDSTGRFVVAWENDNADGTSNIMMRYFSASGSPITGITRVSKPGSTDSNPDVAASNGSFVISWTHQLSATNTDIDAERFVISGGVPVGKGIFGVNTDTNLEDNSSVAMSPGGSFDIAYERQSSVNNRDIFASQYNGSGSFLRSVAVNVDGNLSPSPASRWTTPAMP